MYKFLQGFFGWPCFMVAADTEIKCWSLCQPPRNDAGAWGAVAHMTSTSILFPWVAENRWGLLYSEKTDSDPEDKLGEGENTSGFSFCTLLCQNPIAFLMMGRISGCGLSAEINQKYHLRVTVAMWHSYDLQKFQKKHKKHNSSHCAASYLWE